MWGMDLALVVWWWISGRRLPSTKWKPIMYIQKQTHCVGRKREQLARLEYRIQQSFRASSVCLCVCMCLGIFKPNQTHTHINRTAHRTPTQTKRSQQPSSQSRMALQTKPHGWQHNNNNHNYTQTDTNTHIHWLKSQTTNNNNPAMRDLLAAWNFEKQWILLLLCCCLVGPTVRVCVCVRAWMS